MRLLVAALVAVGFTFGITEVAVVAAADELTLPGGAAPLLALWGIGSLAGGVVVARAGRRVSWRGFGRILLALGITHALLGAAAGSGLLLGACLAVAGSTIAPMYSSAFALAERIVPEDSLTEVFAWLATAIAVGAAAGAPIAGALAEATSVAPAFLLAGACAAVAATVVLVRTIQHEGVTCASAPTSA